MPHVMGAAGYIDAFLWAPPNALHAGPAPATRRIRALRGVRPGRGSPAR